MVCMAPMITLTVSHSGVWFLLTQPEIMSVVPTPPWQQQMILRQLVDQEKTLVVARH